MLLFQHIHHIEAVFLGDGGLVCEGYRGHGDLIANGVGGDDVLLTPAK